MAAAASQTPDSAIGKTLMALVRPLDTVSRYVMITSMIVMTVVVCANVILRFFFAHSIDWADEISRLLFVWSMFLAIPHGVRYGSHVGIDALTHTLPEGLRDKLARLMQVMCAGLCIIVVYMGLLVVQDKWDELMPTIDFTSTVYYFPVVFAMFHSCVHFLILAVCGANVWRRDES